MSIFFKYKFRIVFFLSLLVFGDFAAGKFLKSLYFSQINSPTAKLNFTIDSLSSQIIILGNSRAYHHYNASMISESLGVSCYNAGLDGGHSILLSEALLELIIARYIPEIIILDISPEVFDLNTNGYDKLSILLPYHNRNVRVDSIISLRSQFESLKLLSQSYPFNSQLLNLIRYNRNLQDSNYTSNSTGFGSIRKKSLSYEELKNLYLKSNNRSIYKETDTIKISSFQNIITKCKQYGIKLFVVVSPQFTLDEKDKLKIRFPYLFRDEKISGAFKYLNFSGNYNEKFVKYFVDLKHLNSDGADIFTKELIKDLR